MRTASQIFEEELSGEPLTQESVIEAMNMFAIEVLEEIWCGENHTNDLYNKIYELKQNLNEKV